MNTIEKILATAADTIQAIKDDAASGHQPATPYFDGKKNANLVKSLRSTAQIVVEKLTAAIDGRDLVALLDISRGYANEIANHCPRGHGHKAMCNLSGVLYDAISAENDGIAVARLGGLKVVETLKKMVA